MNKDLGSTVLWFILVCLLLTLAGPVMDVNAQQLRIDEEKLAASIEKAFDRSDFNGYVIVSREGRELFSGGNGSIHEVSGTEPDENTVFGIASITKSLTATGISLLAQRGVIQFTDTIDKYLEKVPEDKQPITIHQLLTHTSGIAGNVADDTEVLGKEEMLNRIYHQKLLFPPGNRYAYSNSGYVLLAAIMDEVSDKGYAHFMQEEVFLPLGMTNTGYPGMSIFDRLHVTHGTYNGKDYGKLSDIPFSWNGLTGNGDVLSTPNDMHAMLNNLTSGRLLTPETLELMRTPHVSEDGGSPFYYGYGWVIDQNNTHGKIISHNGGGLSGNHIITYFEKYDLSILVFSTRIEDRLLLNRFPYYVDYPADQLSEAIVSNILSGNYDQMPSKILPLWRGILIYVAVIVLAVIVGWFLVKLIKTMIGSR